MRASLGLCLLLGGCLDIDALVSGARDMSAGPDMPGSADDLATSTADLLTPDMGAPADQLMPPDMLVPTWYKVFTTPGADALYAIHGTAETAIWAVGAKGVVVNNRNNWAAASVAGMGMSFRGVWGSAATDVWAVGDGGNSFHTTDGTAWNKVTTGQTIAMNGVSGTAANDVWAATDNQKIMGTNYEAMRYDGTAWALSPSSTVQNEMGVFAGKPGGNSLLWIVGDAKSAANYNFGTSLWIKYATTVAGMYNLRGVWASAANNVWAVGTGGVIVRFDGTVWAQVTSNTTEQLNAVWGAAADDVWAVGAKGTAVHWDGTSWTVVPTGITDSLNGVWGIGGGKFWAVGTSGNVYRYK